MQDTNERGRFWIRILAANCLGALAVVGIGGGLWPTVPFHVFARNCLISLVFSNCIGTLLASTLPVVAERCWKGHYRLRWAILVAVMVPVTFIGTALSTGVLLVTGLVRGPSFWRWTLGSFQTALVITLVIGVLVTAFETVRGNLERARVELRTRERDEAEARRVAAEAQLNALEARVHPHFLFNTLNSIAALIPDDPAAAERMTGQLASLLRWSLDSAGSALVPIEQEMRLVRTYLDIERIRFGTRLRASLPTTLPQAQVPRLSIQTLVENSVKFAVSPQLDGAAIRVDVESGPNRIVVTVSDDGPGFEGRELPEQHGLALLGARLAASFGNDAAMHIDSRPGDTRVRLDLPRVSGAPSAAAGVTA